MLRAVRAVRQIHITEDVLLGGSSAKLSIQHWEKVVAAVASFVRNTGRDI